MIFRRAPIAAKFFVSVAILLPPLAIFAQQHESPNYAKIFEKKEVMIPVRDGVQLHTEIYVPKNAAEPLPILLERTPYGISAPDQGISHSLFRYAEMVPDGYIFVFQDIRGRYGSEGKFVMQRPLHDSNDPQGVDESTDAYDTIDWLVKNVAHNNGRVGMDGISYPGFLVTMGLVNPHPALKAVSEQACMGDVFLGDDFFHNGAFRLSYGFEYSALLETSKQNYSFAFDRFDVYEFYLRLGALSNANTKYFKGAIQTWNDFVAHSNYDDFWKRHAVAYGLKETTVPNLNVAGWWDQEDFYGPMTTYERLEKADKKDLNYLVVGPWNHGGWAHGSGQSLGAIPFGSETGAYFRQKIEAPWFAYWLKNKGALPLKEAILFQTGSDTWTTFDAWPPRGAQNRQLYFQEDGKLSFDVPQTDLADSADSYVSDPAHPVPYRHRPIDMTYPEDHPGSWYTWLVQDQRFVDQRPDVLTWQTGELSQDIVLAGQVTAQLFASTTGTDSDWIVKLIDVYPEKYTADWKLSGYELMISDEIFRGRFRKSFEKPEAIKPNEVTPFTIDLHTANHVFKKGHRIMVQVQSTWFPLYDRNPQKFVPNIFEAKESDYQKATQRIYRSKRFPSNVEISVLTANQTGASH
ncbi:MAG TPA: CocE/NonD family hydrolase [Candidatus Dormibacteraeota bacterium]|nr:CocE/NonD family hydrolase [Candidatus Dormibacteraeota bacterium]